MAALLTVVAWAQAPVSWPTPKGAVLKWSDPPGSASRRIAYVVPGRLETSIRFYKQRGYQVASAGPGLRTVFKPVRGVTIVVTTYGFDFGATVRLSGPAPRRGTHFIEVLVSSPAAKRQRP